MARMASERSERRHHSFALGVSRYRSLGKGGVSRGVLSWLQSATTPLDVAKSVPLKMMVRALLSLCLLLSLNSSAKHLFKETGRKMPSSSVLG